MGVMVYLPDYAGSDRAELVTRGLGSLLEPGIGAIFTDTRNGPNGGAGKLVTFYPGNDPREVDAGSQTWMEAPPDGELAKGRYWLGYVTAQKPSAGDLQRRELIDGEPVILDDGNAWVIACSLFAPRRISIDSDSGQEIRVAKSEHKQWVDWSNEIYELILGNGFEAIVENGYIMRIPNGMNYAALTLSKNYRVNRDVIDLLELLDEHELSDVILFATGVTHAARLAAQKKTTDRFSPQPLPS